MAQQMRVARCISPVDSSQQKRSASEVHTTKTHTHVHTSDPERSLQACLAVLLFLFALLFDDADKANDGEEFAVLAVEFSQT